MELTFLAATCGLRMTECPIIFVERREGTSKLSTGVLVESIITPLRLVLRHGRVGSRSGEAAGYNPPGPSR